jgi:hypothetical protein
MDVTIMKYLSLKSAKASKIGQRSQGFIHYRILTDQTHQQLYIIITGNDDDGYYSKEIVPFEKVEQCLQDIKPNVPIPSKFFKKAFIGQSNNNAAFMAAILRNEKLIAPMNDAVRKHTLQSGWDNWKTGMLKDANKAKPFEPELAKPKVAIKKESDNSELDDDEMELLQRSVLDTDVNEDEEPVMLDKKRRPKKP